MRGEPVDQVRVRMRHGSTDLKTPWLSHMLSPSLNVSQAIRAHNDALTNLYFQHAETVQHLQNTLLTQILPNVVDELGLGKSARDWAREWLQDDRKSLNSPALVAASLILCLDE